MNAREEIARACVAVLRGGRSSEREVSQLTGAAVLRALAPPGAQDGRGPARVVDVEVLADGTWRLQGETRPPGAALESLPDDTIFFLGLHGGEGENGAVQGLLGTTGRRHTGSGVAASALCMDKHATRLVLADAGIAVARGLAFDGRAWREERESFLCRARALCGERSADGWVVKPNSGGSSVGTRVVGSADDLAAAIESVAASGDRVLVEARIVGVEATCGVLGNAGSELRAQTPIEIVPKPGRFFDYEEKYSAGGADEICPPRSLPPPTCERLRDLAVRAHRAAGCDGYSRVDFIVPRDAPRDAKGAEGEPVALEINTLPGLTERSLVPKAAAVGGWSMRDLCLEILRLAIERGADR